MDHISIHDLDSDIKVFKYNFRIVESHTYLRPYSLIRMLKYCLQKVLLLLAFFLDFAHYFFLLITSYCSAM